MTAYLGPKDRLVPFEYYLGGLDVSSERAVNKRTTAGGRIYVQRGQVARRSWSVSLNHLSPAELSALSALELSGTPPFTFVEPAARITNVLSPEQSVLETGSWDGSGVVLGGAVTASDGVVSHRSLTHSSGGVMSFGLRDGEADYPVVLPGMSTTWSLYVRGTGNLSISFRDWNNAIIYEQTAAYDTPTLTRVSMTRTAPAGAVSARVWVTGARQAALPALTWTPKAEAWGVGRGCNRVVMEGLSEAVSRVVYNRPSSSRFGLNFSIQEVG